MNLRITREPNGQYRIQEQSPKFIFFGKLVWKYVLNIGEYPWETSTLKKAEQKIAELTTPIKIIKEYEI